MKKETENIISSGIKDGAKGGVVAAASSVITGVGMTTVPVKILGIWTIATTSIISVPVIVSVGVAGAIIGGGISAYSAHRKNNKIKKEFDKYLNSEKEIKNDNL